MFTRFFALIFFVFISFSSFSQYKSGYIITNDGEKINLLIKDEDWLNSPEKIEVKIDQSEKSYSVLDLQEFAIDKTVKYLSREVKIDQSATKTGNLSTLRNPEFIEKRVFIKVLVEGEVNLYSYREPNLIRFYYKNDSLDISPLVYKKFTFKMEIKENNYFRQQLQNLMNDKPEFNFDFNSIDYTQKDLINVFLKYNTLRTIDNSQDTYIHKSKKWKSSLTLRPGYRFTKSSVLNTNGFDEDFHDSHSTRLGLQFNLTAPWRNEKFSLLLEPVFNYYTTNPVNQDRIMSFTYSALELPISFQYNYPISKNSQVYFNTGISFEIHIGTDLLFGVENSLRVNTNPYFICGAGYQINKFQIEGKFAPNKDILSKYRTMKTEIMTAEVIVGYTIFEK
ncbi:hypothetical protein [Marinigracilibium pacificum]|uniref:Outer membrane protein with beta-barrel domain n=1 Tax=Marinigracilibium pacificum TaxID=2729599 RepID=A0A848IVP7_9BACT|nr:hypothetical protein [Marinigracilibium pacificum]NMM47355.1 hypothetical protein [Marinigracilibium pacificum]